MAVVAFDTPVLFDNVQVLTKSNSFQIIYAPLYYEPEAIFHLRRVGPLRFPPALRLRQYRPLRRKKWA